MVVQATWHFFFPFLSLLAFISDLREVYGHAAWHTEWTLGYYLEKQKNPNLIRNHISPFCVGTMNSDEKKKMANENKQNERMIIMKKWHPENGKYTKCEFCTRRRRRRNRTGTKHKLGGNKKPAANTCMRADAPNEQRNPHKMWNEKFYSILFSISTTIVK